MKPPIHSFSATRRTLLCRLLAGGLLLRAGGVPLKAAAAAAMFDHSAGGYRVLPAGPVFCAGVLPSAGFEIVHVLCRPWLPLDAAWSRIEQFLTAQDRPIAALCGMELRVPAQFTPQGFREFNAPYIARLRERGLVFDGYSAVCRTNVAPARDIPPQASLHAFSYCAVAAPGNRGRTFNVSGTADIDSQGNIVAAGDISPAGMRQRMQHCLSVITDRLAAMDLGWQDASHIDLCVVEDIPGLLDSLLVPGLGGAGARGIRVHHARPPIIGAEVELECRGVHRELVLGG